MVSSPTKIQARFALSGVVTPLVKAASGYAPRRALGGWLATYGTLGPNGGVVPTVDRQGHVFEAARSLGRVDFSRYVAKGRWNDTHRDPKVWVGVPTVLEHHDGTTDLSQAHRKVGFWTEGHLYDRDDPRSWQDFGDYVPTETDLAKADEFWAKALMLKGSPRDLGFSAEGGMVLSACGKRIIWAQIDAAAVCDIPQNPDTTAQPLRLALDPLLDPAGLDALLDADPCSTCTCPPNLRCPVLRKSVDTGSIAAAVPEDLEGAPAEHDDDPDESKFERYVRLVMHWSGVDEAQARRWLRSWAADHLSRSPVGGS